MQVSLSVPENKLKSVWISISVLIIAAYRDPFYCSFKQVRIEVCEALAFFKFPFKRFQALLSVLGPLVYHFKMGYTVPDIRYLIIYPGHLLIEYIVRYGT